MAKTSARQPKERSRQKHHHAFIDALRGWAIIGVIMVHCSMVIPPHSKSLLWAMQQGSKGVQLFFIVSAFTLSTSWAIRHTKEGRPALNFFIRRFFRIAPLFYLAILGYTALNGVSATYWAPTGIEWWTIALTGLFAHGFHPESINAVVPGGWSIAVEMTFYLVFLPLTWLIQSFRSAALLLLTSLMIYKLNEIFMPMLFSYPSEHQYIANNFTDLNFASQLPFFILGIACFLITKEAKIYSSLRLVAALSAYVLLAKICATYPATLWAGGIFSAGLILLKYYPFTLLVNRITVTLGKLSYSIYLLHFAILIWLGKTAWIQGLPNDNASSLLFFTLITIITAATAFITHNFIEVPGIALGNIIIDRLRSKSNPKTLQKQSPADSLDSQKQSMK